MKCDAELHIGDDFMDNHATMHCQLNKGHAGPHREKYDHDGPVVVTWVCDDRKGD